MAPSFQSYTGTRLTLYTASLLLLLFGPCPLGVSTFSVGGRRDRDVRSLDLVDALALLQRERRRVGGDFLSSERLLEGRPLTTADVSDWLREARDNGLMVDEDVARFLNDENRVQEEPTWISDGEFKDFETQTVAVKPTKQEIEDIFSDDDEEGEKSETKETKKKSLNSNHEKKLVKKSISSTDDSDSSPAAPSSDENSDISLDTLTKEEFKALMKAVGKLQKQVAAKSKVAIVEDVSEPKEEMAIVQPASREELQSLFAKDDDDVGEEAIVPKNRVVVEEEVETPSGGRRVVEVATPEGGRIVTEVETPDGDKKVIEETIPEGSLGDFQDVLEDSERELTDALASQLEEDISQEAVKEELEAEAEEAEQRAAREEEEVEEEAASAVAQAEQEEAVAAAKEEIAREIGVSSLAALEKLWVAQGNNAAPPSLPEKRTTKRAASSGYNSRYGPVSLPLNPPRGVSDLTLERLLANSDISDLVDIGPEDQDIIKSINEGVKEAALEREALRNQEMQDALSAAGNHNDKEDIIYGSPLTGDDFIDKDEDDNDDIVFDLVPESPDPSTSSSSSNKNKIDQQRLRELASSLSLSSDKFASLDSPDSLTVNNGNDGGNDLEDVDPSEVFDLGPNEIPHLPKEVAGLPPPLGQFVTRIVELQDEVGHLRLIAQLADLENDVLTDALNEATMAQEPGTVSDAEFESLQQAITVEKELQKLKKGISISDLKVLSRPSSTGSVKVAPAADKKGKPWRRKRGKTTTSSSAAAAAADTALQAYPVSPSARSAGLASKADVERLLADTYLRQGKLPDFEDLQMDIEDDTVASIFLPDADECPAVRRYSTNCELADLYSLPVDYEARALCNLHEMCYACGHSLRVSQASCDEVYRAAASTLCREGSACVLEAEIFLRTMKLKTRYTPHSQPTCRSTCTARFLGMF